MVAKTPADATGLTGRQREVIELLALGYSNAEIAESLDISLDGAKWHVGEILARLDVGSRKEAADWWLNRRQRRLRLPRRAFALAFALPLKAAAALGEILRPGPSIRVRVDEDNWDANRSAITERCVSPDDRVVTALTSSEQLPAMGEGSAEDAFVPDAGSGVA